MKIIGNILWFVFGGFLMALGYFLIGLILCITIIGIPFGMQIFKMGKLVLFPFGQKVDSNFGKHPIANIIWLVLFGWEAAISHLLLGVIYCITIIGIPFGMQWFKLAKLAIFPFGANLK